MGRIKKRGGQGGQRRHGLTLVELTLTLMMFVILAGTTIYLFRCTVLAWSAQETRTGIRISLDSGIERVVRDLREAKEIQSTSGYNELRFTQDQNAYYIYYFYNMSDSYVPPPAFNQTFYQLRKASLAGGLRGTFGYGDGEIVLRDVLPPGTSVLSLAGNVVTVDLIVQRKDTTERLRTQICPRNL